MKLTLVSLLAVGTFMCSCGGGGITDPGFTPVPVVTLSASPTSITAGGSVTIKLSSANAMSCSLSWDAASTVTSGTFTVTPAVTTVYTASCTGAGGTTKSAPATVTVTAAPTATVSANPTTITEGQSSTLTYACTNASSCTASGSWTGTLSPMTGTQTVTPTATGTFTYVLTATGSDGTTASDQVVVTVNAPTPLQVSVTGTGATVAAGGTMQFTASISGGTGNPSLLWSVNGVAGGNSTIGNISPTGLYAAPGTVSSPTALTISATATEGLTSESGSAGLTLLPSGRYIVGMSQWLFQVERFGEVIGNIGISGYNFTTADTLKVSPSKYVNASFHVVSSTQLTLTLALDDIGWMPRWFSLQDCDGSGANCSNAVNYAVEQDQNLASALPTSPSPAFAFLAPMPSPNSLTAGSLDLFNLDGSVAPGGYVDSGSILVAADNQTSDLVYGNYLPAAPGDPVTWAAPNGLGGYMISNNPVTSIAARNGIAGGTQTSAGVVAFAPIVNGNGVTPATAPAGTAPWAIDMADGCSTGTMGLSYDREGVGLYRFCLSVSSGNVQVAASGSFNLANAGFATPASQLQAAASNVGGYYLHAFNKASPRAGVAAIIAPLLNTDSLTFNLVFVNVASNQMAQIGNPIPLPQHVVRTAKNDMLGTILVGYADNVAGLSRYVSVDAGTGTVTPLAETSKTLPVGLAVSPDGKSFIACQVDATAPCEVHPYQ